MGMACLVLLDVRAPCCRQGCDELDGAVPPDAAMNEETKAEDGWMAGARTPAMDDGPESRAPVWGLLPFARDEMAGDASPMMAVLTRGSVTRAR